MGLRLVLVAVCVVAIEAKSFLVLDDVTVFVGNSLVYDIGDKQFLADYRVYRVIERGHKSLPDWLKYVNQSSQLIGSPQTEDVGLYTIRVRAECKDPSTKHCQDRISRTFHINVVEPLTAAESRGRPVLPVHVGKVVKHGKKRVKTGSEWQMQPKYTNNIEPTKTFLHESNTSVTPTESHLHDTYNHVITSASPSTIDFPIISPCKPNEISFFASLVLHVVHGLNNSEMLTLKHRMSSFTSKVMELISITAGAAVLKSLQSISNKHILTAGPGNVIESLSDSVELSWHVTCNDFEKITDFAKVLQHNVDVGRFTEELGYDIIAWFVYSDKPVPRRNKRSAHNGGRPQTRTPLMSSLIPSTVTDFGSSTIELLTFSTSLSDKASKTFFSSPLITSSAYSSLISSYMSSSTFRFDRTSDLIEPSLSSTYTLSSEPLKSVLPETHSAIQSTPVSLKSSYDTDIVLFSSFPLTYTFGSSMLPSPVSVLPTPSLAVSITNVTESSFNFSMPLSVLIESTVFSSKSLNTPLSSVSQVINSIFSKSLSSSYYHSKPSTSFAFSSTSKIPPSFVLTSSYFSSFSMIVSTLSPTYVPLFSQSTLMFETSSVLPFTSSGPLTISSVTLDSLISSAYVTNSSVSYFPISESISSNFGPFSVIYSSSDISFTSSNSSIFYVTSSMLFPSAAKTTSEGIFETVTHVFSTLSSLDSSFIDLSPSFSLISSYSSELSSLTTLISLNSYKSSFTSLALSIDHTSFVDIETHFPYATSPLTNTKLSPLLSPTLSSIASTSFGFFLSTKSSVTDVQYTISASNSSTISRFSTLSLSVVSSPSIHTTNSSAAVSMIHSLDLSSVIQSPSTSVALFHSSIPMPVSKTVVTSVNLVSTSENVLASRDTVGSASIILPSFHTSIQLDSSDVETDLYMTDISSLSFITSLIFSTQSNIVFDSVNVSQKTSTRSSVALSSTVPSSVLPFSYIGSSSSGFINLFTTLSFLTVTSIISTSNVFSVSRIVQTFSVFPTTNSVPASNNLSAFVPTSSDFKVSSVVQTSNILRVSSILPTSSILTVSGIVQSSAVLSVSSFLPSSSLLSVSTVVPTSGVLSVSSVLQTSSVSPSITPSSVQPVSSVTPTTAAPDSQPVLQVPIDHIKVSVGRYFELKIPERTFNDTEDGSTSLLNLSISLVYSKPLQPGSWLMFDAVTQTLYGLPLMRDLESGENKQVLEKFILTASDSKGNIAKDVISIAYEYDKDITHDIMLEFDGDFTKFDGDRNALIGVAQRIAKFYGDQGLNFITVFEMMNGSVIINWGNNSLFGKNCQREEIQNMYDNLADGNNTVFDNFTRLFSGIVPVSASLVFRGACLLPLTTLPPNKPPLASEEDEKFWLTIGLPALIVILVIIIVALLLLVCCRHRRPSKELPHSDKPAFLEDRRPIIFPEELEMVDPSLKPKKPLILPSDYLVETPPAVPPHGRTNPPTYQAPVFDDDDMFDNPQVPPPPGMAETATDPPPYRLPPPYFNPHRALQNVNT